MRRVPAAAVARAALPRVPAVVARHHRARRALLYHRGGAACRRSGQVRISAALL